LVWNSFFWRKRDGLFEPRGGSVSIAVGAVIGSISGLSGSNAWKGSVRWRTWRQWL